MDVPERDELRARIQAKLFDAQSLVDLSTKYIIKNINSFLIGKISLHFQNMPNDVVQNFFRVMSEQASGPISPKSISPRERPIIFFVLNKHAEEFSLQNIEKHENPHLKEPLPCNPILNHALDTCPKFQKAFIDLLPYGGRTYKQLLMKISIKWTHLKMLRLRGKKILNNKIVLQIRMHLPSLETLVFEDTSSVQSLDKFTSESCSHFAQMKCLKLLSFRLGISFMFTQPIWAHIAGQVPSLEKLLIHEDFQHGSSLPFLSYYEKFYPDKPLVLEYFRLGGPDQSNAVVKWPQHVSVDILSLEGQQSSEVLAMVPRKVKELVICGEITPQEVTKYVEIFGNGLTSLKINTSAVENGQSLNVLPLLEACPLVEQVSIFHSGPILQNCSNCVLPPNWFGKIKEFAINGDWEDEVFVAKVLSGSQHFCSNPYLNVCSAAKMRAILHVLRQKDSCRFYSKLAKVDLVISRGENELLPFFDECFEVAYRLIENSPVQLKRISLTVKGIELAELSSLDVEHKIAELKNFAADLSIQCCVKVP